MVRCDFDAPLTIDCQAGGVNSEIMSTRLGTESSEPLDLLSGEDGQRIPVNFMPGDMVLFRGRHSLHRVTSIKGEVSRLIALMSFDNVKKALERDVPDDLLPS